MGEGICVGRWQRVRVDGQLYGGSFMGKVISLRAFAEC